MQQRIEAAHSAGRGTASLEAAQFRDHNTEAGHVHCFEYRASRTYSGTSTTRAIAVNNIVIHIVSRAHIVLCNVQCKGAPSNDRWALIDGL